MYKTVTIPKHLVIDRSMTLLISVLQAFNHESVPNFLNRCFRIVNGIADEADFGKVMVHACIAHVMKSIKNDLKKIRLKHKASQNIEFSSHNYFVSFQQQIGEPHFHDVLFLSLCEFMEP